MNTPAPASPGRALPAAVAGALLIAMSGPLVALSGAAPITSAAFRCLYALPALGLLAWYEHRRWGARSWSSHRASILAGVCFTADLTLWHHSIDAVGAGLATVLANVQVVVTGLVAWLVLHERPSGRTVGAVPVVLVGVALIAGVTGGGYGRDPVLGAALGLGAAVAYSGFFLLLRQGTVERRRPGAPLAEATATATVCLTVLGLVTGGLDVAPSWPSHGYLLLLALGSGVVAWLLISTAMPRLPALATSIVLLLQPVGSVLIGLVALGEEPSAAQVLGVVLVLVGVVVAQTRPRRRDRRPAAVADPGDPVEPVRDPVP